MSNVIQFPKVEVHRCKTAKEAESHFHHVSNGAAKSLCTKRLGKGQWLVTIVFWPSAKTDAEIAAENLTREVARWNA